MLKIIQPFPRFHELNGLIGQPKNAVTSNTIYGILIHTIECAQSVQSTAGGTYEESI
jgi:hypothetical protein